MTIPAICQQLAACCGSPAPYIDGDEVRCRTCSRSISFPTTTPDALLMAEEGGRANGNPTAKLDPPIMVCCVECGLELSAVRERCPGCGQVVVEFNSETIRGDPVYMLPEFDPPRLLDCRCCRRWLPQFCFYVNRRQVSREGRFIYCKACVSAQKLLQRLTDPEPNRARARATSQQNQAERRQGKRPPVYATLSEEQKESKRQSVRRYRERLRGMRVPLLKPGRAPIYLKQICRIGDSCPLARFCTTEAKGLG